MNQSLVALLVHGTITYAEAMLRSPDPEDLSLKLRKMFPKIEEQGGDMSQASSDFSQILELQQIQKLYEEQEEKTKHPPRREGTRRIGESGAEMVEREAQIQQLSAGCKLAGSEREEPQRRQPGAQGSSGEDRQAQ